MADDPSERRSYNRRILMRQRSWTYVPDKFLQVKVKIVETEESTPVFQVPKKVTMQKQLTWPVVDLLNEQNVSIERNSDDTELEKNPLRCSSNKDKNSLILSKQNIECYRNSPEAKALTPYLNKQSAKFQRHCSVSKNYKYPSLHQNCRKENSSQSPCRKRLKLNSDEFSSLNWYFKFLFYCFISLVTFLLCYSYQTDSVIMDHILQFLQPNNPYENYCNISMESLKYSLFAKVIGQHSSVRDIIEALETYERLIPIAELKNCSSITDNRISDACPLVLSLHGSVGVGKTFISSIIMNHFCSNCVHFFVIPFHFPELDFQGNQAYFNLIVNLLSTSLNSCPLKLVVFEDVDDAPSGIVSGLETMINTWTNKYPKTIIILTSSAGKETIRNFAERGLRNNLTRKDLNLKELRSAVISDLHSDPSVLQKPWKKALANNLKVQVIPLLPFEKQHVIQCIITTLQLQNIKITNNLIEKILDYQVFIPPEAPIFSKIGCNSVNSRINLIVDYTMKET